MIVADVMSSPAHTASPSDALARAAQIMWDQDIGAVPIVDQQARVIAMITDRDICMAAFTQGRSLAELRVREAMSKLVYTCHPDDRLSAAERTMRVHQVRRLPVVDDAGRIVGVLALNDICRARAQEGVHAFTSDVVKTLAAIGQARGAEVQPLSEAPPSQLSAIGSRANVEAAPRMPPQPIRDPAALFRF